MGVKKTTEFKPEEKFRHLDKLKATILQCVSCGDCREATDYTTDPQKWGVCPIRDHTPGFEPYFGRGKMQIIRSLWQGKLDLSKDMADVIFQCSTCNACSETCYYKIETVSFYEALRAELVDAGFGLETYIPMNKAMVELLNPYQRDNKQKGDWLKKLDFKVKDANSEKTELLYFVGCTAALTPDIQSVAVSTANVLRKLDIDFGVFGEHEVCCGSVAMRTGDRKAFNTVADKNISMFKQAGIKTIITSCAGCYRTLRNNYAELLKDSGIKILHTVEFVQKILKEKNVNLKNLGINTTYHDPCHAGRHSGLYEEPRELLREVADITEMKRIKENAFCCGAGGGLKKGFPELALEVAKTRVQEAEETGVENLISICPFCYRNLSDAIKALGSEMKMVDLLELIDQALE
ncbi:MAG: (Fe-S)-binding protein [Promethearchaeota archaeon]